MEMNYFKKTGKMMVAACMPGTAVYSQYSFQRPNFRHK